MTDTLTIDMIEESLDLVAEWLIAAGPLADCYGIVPITLGRGSGSDGRQETRETLPTRQACEQAEALFRRLCPEMHFDHDNVRDVRHVGSSRLVAASDVSAHRRIELRRRYGVCAE